MANIYVRKSGNDSNDGSTPELAKLTISGAVSSASDNDTIYIGAGLWKEQNITIGADKGLSIYGDPTGEYTGDAGEVIWTGVSSSDDYTEADSYAIYNTTAGYKIDIQNIIFQNWRVTDAAVISSKGPLTVKNCKGINICGVNKQSVAFVYYRNTSYKYPVYIENVYIDGVYALSSSYPRCYGVFVSSGGSWGTRIISIKNVKIRNIVAIGSTGVAEAYGVYASGSTYINPTLFNIDVENIYGCSAGARVAGIYAFWSYQNLSTYNCSIHNVFAVGTVSSYGVQAYGTELNANNTTYAYNCSVSNTFAINTAGGTDVTYANHYIGNGLVDSNPINKANFFTFTIPQISKFSPLIGGGHATIGTTTDINGNIKPTYGNTVGNIGALESTSDIVQKESTVKDSGDYSMKVSPCNYFKREFQIPVTASELRTVKAKIRIDGTWGDYRPKITLSGQGMTASSATKNATTGSFEELTVSGTPTTNGIALLTVEAHSASTDAVFYIDTITIE